MNQVSKVGPSSGRFAKIPFFRLPQTRSRRLLLAGVGFLVLMLPIALASLLFSPQTEAAWFDNAYGFRQRVPIANSSGSIQTDFQVELSLDTSTLISAGKLQADCDDLRFTARDGKLLNYWLEPNTCNTSTTKVFVNVPSIPTSGADIFWYYGNPQVSSASTVDHTFLSEMPGPVAAWPLDDTTTTQSYARVVNPGANVGRNIIINGTYDADSDWTKGSPNWSIAAGVAHSDGTNGSSSTLSQSSLIQGKVYEATYTLSNWAAGTVTVQAGGTAGAGTTRSSNGTYTEVLPTAVGANLRFIASAGFIGDVDNVSVRQLNIPSSSTVATNLLTDGDMEASGTTSWTAVGTTTLSKQTGLPYQGSQVLRIAQTATSNPIRARQSSTLTVGNVYRVSGYAKGDGTAYPRLYDGVTFQWTGTVSTHWQPFDVVFVATGDRIDLIGNTSIVNTYVEFDSVVLTSDTTIRPGELLQDANMEATGAPNWTANVNATLSKQTNAPQGGNQVIRVTYGGSSSDFANQPVGVAGKTYRATGYARSDGTANVRVANASTSAVWIGTNSTSWQYFDVTFIQTGTNVKFGGSSMGSGNYVEYDDVSVTEVSPLVGKPTNGVTLGTSSGTGGHLATAYSFDGTNDNVNIYSSDLNSVFNPDEGTLVAWAKVSGAGAWTDGVTRRVVNIGADSGSNQIVIYRDTANSIGVQYAAGGVAEIVQMPTSSTGWIMISLTWDKTQDEVKAYLNGSQSGSTQTGLGTWNGNLLSTNNVVGAWTSSGTNPWSGLINDVRLYDRALSSTEVASLYSGNGDIQAYNTSNYTGKDLLRKFNAGITVGTLATEEIGAAPVAYWKFDEGQGPTVQDSSTNNHDGTLGANSSASSDDPTWITEDQCVSGKCLRFDGGDFVNVGQNINLSSGKISAGVWIRPQSVNANQVFIGQEQSTGPFGWSLRIDGNQQLSFVVNNSNWARTTQLPELNKWSYVSGTFDGSVIKLYLNGNEVATTNYSGSVYQPDLDVMIGNTPGFNRFYNGALDEPRLYSYARSAAQVKEDFNQGAALLGSQNQTFLSNGLVGYWKMDEASWNGTASEVKDASGNGNHGAAAGGATAGAGKYGNGGVFDGTNDYVTVPNSTNLQLTNNFTLSLWFKAGSTSQSQKYLINKNNYYGILYEYVNDTLEFWSGSGRYTGDDPRVGTGITLADTNWHHIVYSYDGKTLSGYKDGVQIFSLPKVFTLLTSTDVLYLGSAASAANLVNGSLDETRIYNRALSPAEVADLYSYAPGPVGHWKFDEGTGTTAVDSSGNGNNGAITSATYSEGKMGNALSFDGIDDYINLGNGTSLQINKNITLMAWIKTSNTSPQSIIDRYHSGGGAYMFSTGLSTGRLEYLNYDGTNIISGNTTSSVTNGTWKHVAVTVENDSGVMKWYVDGVNIETDTFTPIGAWLNTQDIFIGHRNKAGSEQWFNGLIDDVRIYNYARSPAQILEDMGGGVPPSISSNVLPDPIAHYKLDEQSGQVANNFGSGGSVLSGTLGANSSASTDDPTWKTNADCKLNGCASFSADFINIGNRPELDMTSAVSVSAWVKGSSFTSWDQIAGKWQDSANGYALYTGNSAAHAMFQAGIGGSKRQLEGITPINDGNWHHLVGTYDGTALKLYVDGKLDNSANYPGSITVNSVSSTIGARSNGSSDMFGGSIDEVKIYNVALSADQVALDMNASAPVNFAATSPQESSMLSGGAGAPPVAVWEMDEKTGSTVKDSSGNGNTGTLTGGPTWDVGKVGSALRFDGVDDYVTVADNSVLSPGSGNYSVGAWVKIPTNYSAVGHVYSNYGSSTNNLVLMYISSTGIPTCVYRDGDNNNITSVASTHIKDDKWHHITCVRNGSAGNLYIDGQFAHSATNGSLGTITTTGMVKNIGKNATGAVGYFNGLIDQVRVYNYARSPAQIAYDFNGGQPTAWWRLDECEGATLKDVSGNANSGTLTVGGSGSQSSIGTCDTAGTAWSNGKTGKFNASLNLDGTDDFASIADPASGLLDAGTSDFSAGAWIKTSSSSKQAIIAKGLAASGTNGAGWSIFKESDGQLRFNLNDGTMAGYSFPSDLDDGNWHHVLVTFSRAGVATGYVDGVAVGSTSIAARSGSVSNTGSLYLGRFNDAAGYFAGQLDDARYYSYVLGADQVKQVYNGGAIRFGE